MYAKIHRRSESGLGIISTRSTHKQPTPRLQPSEAPSVAEVVRRWALASTNPIPAPCSSARLPRSNRPDPLPVHMLWVSLLCLPEVVLLTREAAALGC